MKLGFFNITNYVLMILGVLGFFTIVDGYGGLDMKLNTKEKFTRNYYKKGGKSSRRYSDNYLLLPTSKLSQQEKKFININDEKDDYSHIYHAVNGKKRTCS